MHSLQNYSVHFALIARLYSDFTVFSSYLHPVNIEPSYEPKYAIRPSPPLSDIAALLQRHSSYKLLRAHLLLLFMRRVSLHLQLPIHWCRILVLREDRSYSRVLSSWNYGIAYRPAKRISQADWDQRNNPTSLHRLNQYREATCTSPQNLTVFRSYGSLGRDVNQR